MSRLTDRIRRFQRLGKLAAAGERRAGQNLTAAQRQLTNENARLRELADYAAAPAPAAEAPAHAANRLRFAARLRAAIAQQRQTVGKAQRDVEAARSHWFAARRNTERFETVLRKLADERQTEEEKALMTTLDEYAARHYRRGGRR